MPDDPFRSGTNDYAYFVSSNSSYYVVFSYGTDRAANITAISNAGALTTSGTVDDVCVTNGTPAGASNC